MPDINSVVLVGRLVRDAELKYTPAGQAVSKFHIAVNRRIKDGDNWKDEANFFDVILWGRIAESISKYLEKGKQIAVSGELRQYRWNQDGQNRSKVEIVAEYVQLLGNRSDNGSTSGSTSGQGKPAARQPDPDDGFTDDIPF